MSEIEINELNRTALEKLESDDIITNKDLKNAEKAFARNAKKNPCHISYQNLGYFYLNDFQDGKSLKGIKESLKYLELAKKFQKSYPNFISFGKAYFKLKDYEKALENYTEALKMKRNTVTLYNVSLVLYIMNKMDSAYTYAKELYALIQTCDDYEKDQVVALCLYIFQRRDLEGTVKLLKNMDDGLKNSDTLMAECFKVAFLCKEYEIAYEYWNMIKDMWVCNCEEYAMLIECAERLNLEINKEIMEQLEFSKYNKKEFRVKQKIRDDRGYRNEVINNFKYDGDVIDECCYIGCRKHNTQV